MNLLVVFLIFICVSIHNCGSSDFSTTDSLFRYGSGKDKHRLESGLGGDNLRKNDFDSTSSRNRLRGFLETFSPNPITVESMFRTFLEVPSFQDIFDPLNSSSVCTNDTKLLLYGVLSGKNWTVPFLDASGKPGPSITKGRLNFVGNYDQCKDAVAPSSAPDESHRFTGGYYVLTFLTPKPKSKTIMGLCLPNTCSDIEIQTISTELVRKLEMNITVKSVERRRAETEITAATIISITILSVVGCLVIVGTLYDLFFIQTWYNLVSEETTPLDSRSKRENYEAISYQEVVQYSASGTNYSYLGKILLAFSAFTNGKKVLNVSQTSESLGAIHGIRFLSICWVVLGHVFMNGRKYSINLSTELPKLLERWTFEAVVNAYPSVDTFFALSGLLTSYLTILEMRKKGWNINWPKFYFHRFWRLTPPYMIVLVIFLGLTQYLGEGPLWGDQQPSDKERCENDWWYNLLYINNFKPMDELCMGHSWYLANDMQFFILSPLMLIPLYFHRVAGVLICGVFLFVSWITTGVLSSENDWPTSPSSLDLSPSDRQNWSDDYYTKPWCRIGPFIVGILGGYILAVIKGKSLRLKYWVVALGWILTTGSAIFIVYGLYGDVSRKHPSSTDVAALYNSIARSVWGAAICWIIIACHTGYGGPVNAFLSWSPFVVLGRLSYMIYLIHLNILHIFYQNMGALYYMNTLTMTILFIGLLVFSTFASFFFMLCFESPMIGLEKAFLRQRKHK